MAFNFSRYRNRELFSNTDSSYVKQFNARDITEIEQYSTAEFAWSTSFHVEEEYWGTGVRFYKLADTYYGDPSLWWIIPWFNQRPLESDFDAGDVVMIPLPLERVLSYFK